MDEKLLNEISNKYEAIVTIEDGTIEGGFGSAVMEWLSEHNHNIIVKRLGVPDKWITHAKVEQLHARCGFDIMGITDAVRQLYREIPAINNFDITSK